jgi:hypothetical protein
LPTYADGSRGSFSFCVLTHIQLCKAISLLETVTQIHNIPRFIDFMRYFSSCALRRFAETDCKLLNTPYYRSNLLKSSSITYYSLSISLPLKIFLQVLLLTRHITYISQADYTCSFVLKFCTAIAANTRNQKTQLQILSPTNLFNKSWFRTLFGLQYEQTSIFKALVSFNSS